MSKMTRKLAFVLATVFSIVIAGAVLPGCDNGKPNQQQQPD